MGYKVNFMGLILIRCIKLRMHLLYRTFCFKSNLAEFLAHYGGNLDFLDKFLALAYARTKIFSIKVSISSLLKIPPNNFLNKIFCKVDTYVVLCSESKFGP